MEAETSRKLIAKLEAGRKEWRRRKEEELAVPKRKREEEVAVQKAKREAELAEEMELLKRETRATVKSAKCEEKAERVSRYRQRGYRDKHGKFKPRIEEVTSIQLKAPKQPKPPKPDSTQQLKTLSINVETLKTHTAQLKEMNDKLNTVKARTAKLESTMNAEPKIESSRHKGWKQAYLVLLKTSP